MEKIIARMASAKFMRNLVLSVGSDLLILIIGLLLGATLNNLLF